MSRYFISDARVLANYFKKALRKPKIDITVHYTVARHGWIDYLERVKEHVPARRELKRLIAFYTSLGTDFRCLGNGLGVQRKFGYIARVVKQALSARHQRSCKFCRFVRKKRALRLAGNRCFGCRRRVDMVAKKAAGLIGIRCADCFKTFCLPCARRHFRWPRRGGPRGRKQL